MSLNGRIGALEHQDEQNPTTTTAAERDRRLRAVLDLYEERGWRPTGQADADQRFATILYVMLRVAERTAKEDPTPDALAEVELWRERQALFKAAA
jgi:hypothetical protein